MSRPTAGYLRDVAVAAVIGALHSAHQGGPWALVECVSGYDGIEPMTRLTFAVGNQYPDDDGDKRPRVTVKVIDD